MPLSLRTALYRLLLACGLLVFAPAAVAWNAAGHRLGAAIAWSHLQPAVRTTIARLLVAHPDSSVWTLQAGSDAPEDLFVEAATWPDSIRRDPRFTDRPQPGNAHPDRARHRDWHFVDQPVQGDRHALRGGQLHHALPAQAARLADTARPAAERAEALAWLCHLVGDAHQPLHTATRLIPATRGDDDDEGGNGLQVVLAGGRSTQPISLHRYWDTLPGTTVLRGARLQRRASALIAAHPADSIAQGDTTAWIDESFALAQRFAYPAVVEVPHPLDDDYRQRAEALAERQVAASGHRLGRWLNQLLGAPDTPRP